MNGVLPTSFQSSCLAYLDYISTGLKKSLNLKTGHEFRTFGAGIGANDVAIFRFPGEEFGNTKLLTRRSQDSESLILIGPPYSDNRLRKRLEIPADTYFEILNEKEKIMASGRVVRIEDLIRSHETFLANGGHSPNVEDGRVVFQFGSGKLTVTEIDGKFLSSISEHEKTGSSVSDSLFSLGSHLMLIGNKKMAKDVMYVHQNCLHEITFLLKQEKKRIKKNQVRKYNRALAKVVPQL